MAAAMCCSLVSNTYLCFRLLLTRGGLYLIQRLTDQVSLFLADSILVSSKNPRITRATIPPEILSPSAALHISTITTAVRTTTLL